jgi:hypothetical protein
VGVKGGKTMIFELIRGSRASPGARGRALLQKPIRPGQGPCVSVGFRGFLVAFLGSPADFPALPALF